MQISKETLGMDLITSVSNAEISSDICVTSLAAKDLSSSSWLLPKLKHFYVQDNNIGTPFKCVNHMAMISVWTISKLSTKMAISKPFKYRFCLEIWWSSSTGTIVSELHINDKYQREYHIICLHYTMHWILYSTSAFWFYILPVSLCLPSYKHKNSFYVNEYDINLK